MSSEKYSNNGNGNLNASITNSATTVILVSVASFPATGQFSILVETELMLVTAVSGNTFTVTRGVEGTTAVSHTGGSIVSQVMTKRALDQIISDNSQIGALSGLPSSEKAGRIYLSTDSPYGFHDNGSIWDAFELPILKKPILSDWSLINAKSGGTLTTLTQANGSVFLYGPTDTADSTTLALKNIPSAPYKCTFYIKPYLLQANYTSFGVAWLQSSNAHFKGLYQYSNIPTLFLEVGRSLNGTYGITTSITALKTLNIFNWYRLRDDNTNQYYEVSADGFNWITVYSDARNTDITADKVGFFINPRNADGNVVAASLLSYKET